jgi:hypothetical protein
MNNVIRNVTAGATNDAYKNKVGYVLAKAIAEDNEAETGIKTCVVRIIDYIDTFNGNDRTHYSFDVVELLVESEL